MHGGAGHGIRRDMIGPHGEKRPDDPIANAVHIARLATRETEEQYVERCNPSEGKRRCVARPKDGRSRAGR